jgi:hypothetical protein
VPLIDQATGEILDPELVVVLDLLECDREGLVVVDLKTAARKYTDKQVETSLQLSIYSYAAEMGGLADQGDVRLRFDVLTKTKQPELHRYWTSRDRAANVRLFRLASEVLHGVEAEVFRRTWGGCARSVSSRASAGRGSRRQRPHGPRLALRLGGGGERDEQVIPQSRSRKVNGYVKAVLRLQEVRRKREERYDRYVRSAEVGRERRFPRMALCLLSSSAEERAEGTRE